MPGNINWGVRYFHKFRWRFANGRCREQFGEVVKISAVSSGIPAPVTEFTTRHSIATAQSVAVVKIPA